MTTLISIFCPTRERAKFAHGCIHIRIVFYRYHHTVIAKLG